MTNPPQNESNDPEGSSKTFSESAKQAGPVRNPVLETSSETSKNVAEQNSTIEELANEEPALNIEKLKRDSVRGGMVTLTSQGATVAIQLASTVILARLLSPKDYGVIAMVMAVTAFAGLFRDMGLSSASIQKKDLTREQQSNLFWLNVGMGTLLTLIVAAGSPLVAWFYNRPELTLVTLALSTSFLLSSFGAQSGAFLIREMKFGRRAIATLTGALVGLIVAVAFAWNGFTYWSLVWGNLTNAAISTILLFAFSTFRPMLPHRGSGIRDMLKFGAHVTAFDFVNYFHRNLDNLLIGRFWGADALGLYSRAYALIMFPLQIVRVPIQTVAFPALCQLKETPFIFKAYYCRIVGLVAMFGMPIVAYILANGHSVILLLLGKQWIEVTPVFLILGTVAFIQPAITLWGLVPMSLGKADKYLRLGIFNTSISVIAFLLGLSWGIKGVAIGYSIATYISAYPILRYAFDETSLEFSDIIKEISLPAFASIIASFGGRYFLIALNIPNTVTSMLYSGPFFTILYLAILGSSIKGRRDIEYIIHLIKKIIQPVKVTIN